MKRLFLTLVFALPLISFAGGKEIKVTVNGMVCGFCAQGITKKFKAEASVEKIDVSLENKTVVIALKEGKTLEDDQIKNILKKSGYDTQKIERN